MSDTRTSIVLVGQPNVGKSVLFHALTGKYETVSNFPGTTVDVARGVGSFHGTKRVVYDTPGVLSLIPRTDDERVARDMIINTKPDVVVQVADCKDLSRALHITMELSAFHLPMVLVLNMSDEARDRGIIIDSKHLSERLGVPVVETVAITGEGIPELKSAIETARVPKASPLHNGEVVKVLKRIQGAFDAERFPFAEAVSLALLLNDQSAWSHAAQFVKKDHICRIEHELKDAKRRFARSQEMLYFEAKQGMVQELVGESRSQKAASGGNFSARLGLWTMRPFTGLVIAAATLFLMYLFVGVFGATVLVGLLEEKLFNGFINPLITSVSDRFIPIDFIRDLLVGEYGLVTMALTYSVALIFPIVTTFFLFFGALEDSGYLPRLAVMMDRFFRAIGLNGKAVFPMVLGLGCGTMATVTTRILGSKKEKILVSLLLTLAVPCSAQLGVIFGMSAALSLKVLAVWLGVIVGSMMLVGWGASKLLPGGRPSFITELPPLRFPQVSNVVRKVRSRLKWYAIEVIPLFLAATVVLFFLDRFGFLQGIKNVFSPVVTGFLGLPDKATEAFIIGFLRRDYGAAGFFVLSRDGLLNVRQLVVSLTMITLFMPCLAHLLVTVKERGKRTAFFIFSFVMVYALLVGGALNFVLKWTGFL